MNGCLVSNTGPLIALAIIEQLDILKKLFSEVSIAEAVHHELLQGGATWAGVAAYKQSSWIQVRELSNPLEPLLDTVLDTGEASAIQLFCESKANFLLMDERKGRKVAREIYKIPVVGCAGILVEAKRRGIIESVRQSIEGMRNGGYWIHDKIVEFALKEVGET